MSHNKNHDSQQLPVGRLGIISPYSCAELGTKVDNYLVSWRKKRHNEGVLYEGYDRDTYLIGSDLPRFGSGEAKGILKESVRGDDIYILVDVCNYSLTYSLAGQTNHMSPDDHYQNLKRIIAAIAGKARRINVIMPFLYESRQHRRTGRESLDCALALQELIQMGVENIITFDAHDPRIQNAIPLYGFETVQSAYQFIKNLLKKEKDLKLDKEHLMVISPDEGGMGGGSGIFSVGKSKAQLFEKNSPVKVTFKDVAGLAEAKQEVEEIVEFLKQPQKYTDLGGKIPKGALLVGPPGTGKTLLAKAVAGEANVPFFSLAGSDFVEMFVGVGASRVRDLFRQAKEKAPCIVFIDEIDAVGRARAKAAAMGGNDERENTLNQLLTEMDGFGSNSGVIILAATNRVDVLDKALLRAGRFDRQIHVDLPDVNERKEVFGVHLRPIKIDNTVDVELLARQTPGFSGADIANVCNEAALIAARHGKKFVEKQDFLDAVDRIVGGLEKKTKITTEEERRSIAIHEAGHASISWLLEYANPLIKVTIVPRGRALGAAWYLPEERQITTKEQMLDEMCATLGGRAAEDLFLGRISTGAMNDLERVTKQAYGMIAYLGMSDKLPNLCYYNNEEYSFNRPYSEKTAELIDEEVKRMVNEQYERAKKILSDNKDGHNQLAQQLIDKEVIFAEDVEAIFGKRPWASRSEEIISASKTSKELKEAEEQEAARAEEAEKEVKEEESRNTEASDNTESKN